MDFDSVFNSSFSRILHEQGAGEAFFRDFYDEFVSGSQEVAEGFKNTEMSQQRKMLKESFYHVLSFSVTKEGPDYLAQIAAAQTRNHHPIGPELYDLWLESLIGTVKQHDAEFSDDVELAWRLVMAKGIAYMKFKFVP